MPAKTPSFRERFVRIADVEKRLPPMAELEDLAGYCSEWQMLANDFETAAGDFAADVDMLADEATPRDELEEIRENLRKSAERLAGALDELSHFTEGLQ